MSFRYRDQKGAIYVLGALIIVPLLLLVGVAVDGASGFLNQRRLQAAVEAAVKAGSLQQTQGDMTTQAENVFRANTSGLQNVTGPTVTVNPVQKTLTVSANIAVSTTFMAIAGMRNITFTATATMPFSAASLEVAIVIDSSVNSACNKGSWWWSWWGNWYAWWGWNRGWGGCGKGCGGGHGDSFLEDIAEALVPFVNELPSGTLVSIVPFSTEVLFDATTTVQANFLSHFSPTGTDEAASPAFFPLNTSHYTWGSTTLLSVGNYFYGDNFTTKTSYYPLPGTCPGGYPSCSVLYPGMCPSQLKCTSKQSCTSQYTYDVPPMVPILPLTANRSLIATYLNTLGQFTGGSDGAWLSLAVWGWRTLDPAWGDFFKTNSNSQDSSRSTGTYPSAYGGRVAKNVILIITGPSYWNYDTGCYYTNKCGDTTQQRQGGCHWSHPAYFPIQTWKVTAYGVIPMANSSLDDGTCDNYDYQTLDDALGLNFSPTSYLTNVDFCTYRNGILRAIDQKTLNVINNMKAQGINVFVVTLKPCNRWRYYWNPCGYYQSCDSVAARLASYASNPDYYYELNNFNQKLSQCLDDINNQLQQIASGS